MIGRLRELRTKQRLPGSKHFQIGCITMLHQQSSASQSRLQGSDLFIQQDSFSLTGLIGNQRIIHLTTGIEQRLLKAERRFFLLRTGNAVLRHHLPSVKERLRKRTYRRREKLARIDNHRPGGVCPSGASA